MNTGTRALRLMQSFARAGALGFALTVAAAGIAAADAPPEPGDTVSDTGTAAADRTVSLNGEVNLSSATAVIDRLRALSAADPHADITLRINSGGGDVNQGLAIADVMSSIPNDIRTVCEGNADSMAALLLVMGAPGKREALPSCEIMLHQLSWSAQGKVTDLNINTSWGNHQRAVMDRLLASRSGGSQEFIHQLTERDLYLSAAEAKQMGFIDRVLPAAKNYPPPPRPSLPDNFCNEGRAHLFICRPPIPPN
jgi:ATP-dependent Clp protease protease subunit